MKKNQKTIKQTAKKNATQKTELKVALSTE